MKAILHADLTFNRLVGDDVPTDPERTRIWVPVDKPKPSEGEIVVEIAPEVSATHATQRWDIRTEPVESSNRRIREAVIRQAVEDLKSIRDSNGTLTALQLSNAVRAIAKALVAVIEEIRP